MSIPDSYKYNDIDTDEFDLVTKLATKHKIISVSNGGKDMELSKIFLDLFLANAEKYSPSVAMINTIHAFCEGAEGTEKMMISNYVMCIFEYQKSPLYEIISKDIEENLDRTVSEQENRKLIDDFIDRYNKK